MAQKNLEISLKEYLFDQAVAKNHYPFKYWTSNRTLFINISFWIWVCWMAMALFAILLPVDNQQKLSREALVVFESAFQYIVRLLKKHPNISSQSAVNISPSNWNYEAYLFLYLTIFLIGISTYCLYIVKQFLNKLKNIVDHTEASTFKPKIVGFGESITYLWLASSILVAWNTFALLYMEKPKSTTEMYTLLFSVADATGKKIYHKSLTTLGIITVLLDIAICVPIVSIYWKNCRELFHGNKFFFGRMRIQEKHMASVSRNSELEQIILQSMHMKTGGDYRVPGATEYLVEIEGVQKYFNVIGGHFHALRDINLKIKHGEFIVVLGYSGSGKTTLLNILAGIDRPTLGKCIIDGCNTTLMSDSDLNLFRRQKIGYIFQNYALLPNLTASENIAITHGMDQGPKLNQFIELYKNTKSSLLSVFKQTFKSKTNKDELEYLMEALGLTEHKDKHPYHLSGGQQQRVAITRAIIKKPKILLADEPTGAIDHSMTKSILELFYNINQYANTTVILITHNPLIAKMAKRVLYVAEGRIVNDVINENPVHPRDIKEL